MQLKNILNEKLYLCTLMNIEKNISELLFEHDCVIIPDFGGFVCSYSSASVHKSKHQFHPPFKKISFNRNLKNNDGLLANQVAQARQISYSDSIHLISEYVDDLKKTLTDNKRFVFSHIGIIYLGEENNLLFEQDEKVNYLPESLGLTIFNSPAIKREPLEKKIERNFKDKVIIPSKAKHGVVPVKQKNSSYLLAAAAISILVFLIWLPIQSGIIKNPDYSTLNPFASKGEPLYQPSEMNQPDVDIDINKENLKRLLASANDTTRYLNIVIDGRFPVVVQLKEDATAVVKTKKKDSITRGRFHIVGGAFIVSENAEKFYDKLIKNGHQAIIIERNNLHFVSYGGFATKAEAVRALDKIRAIQGDVWLMTN
jgi:CCDC81-like prokaryotic HU domain 1/CCDC81-like prokaryotic HU domain 2/SPOR domain